MWSQRTRYARVVPEGGKSRAVPFGSPFATKWMYKAGSKPEGAQWLCSSESPRNVRHVQRTVVENNGITREDLNPHK